MNDHIFREYDIRGIVGEDLTEESVTQVAAAVAVFYRRYGAKRVAIGYDARESSPVFAEILGAGLNASGLDTVFIGRVPTPVLYHTVYTRDVDGGVMITGSHNPPNYNGFKICLGKQTLFGPQIQEIKEIAVDAAGVEGQGTGDGRHGTTEEIDVLDDYRADILSRISLGDRRLKAVVDSGNGMGGVTAIPVFDGLGIEVVELFSEPDSSFPNHHPDPTVEKNLEDTISAVHEHNADIGIAFDGDGDRIGVVDETGRVIWGDELMVLFSRSVLKENPGATIIAEVKCSQNLYDDIEKRGGKAIMYKAGHSLIKAKMKETGAVLAGEMSGHIFFADRFYGFDDACYAACRLLEILSTTDKQLSALLSDLPEIYSTPELRVPCAEEKKVGIVEQIAEEFAESHDVETIDGARIKFADGWGLVRASNTQAILVLRFEANSENALGEIRKKVESRVNQLIAD